ncbi:MAG TPA: histidine phosphatase family protein [Rhizomicrobium sp.]|nr:histidine phosphatase family protein [Rhizomicrobium sp.]
MKRLYLLRHAKAVAAEPSVDDFARELAARGHADATRLGVWLAEKKLQPALVLCSPARRTAETWQDVSQAFEKPPELQFARALYLASANHILAELRKVAADCESLMVIGHNPGLESLALHLVKRPKGDKAKDRLREMAQGFPTCALGIFEFDIGKWKDLAAGEGELTHFIRPKDLKD